MSGRNAQPGLRSSTVQNRIKKMMQSDDDVGKVAAASTFLVACALEKFLDTLLEGAIDIAQERNARTLTSSHIKASVHANPLLDFCKPHVAAAADLPPPGSIEPTKTSPTKRPTAATDGGTVSKRARAGTKAGGRGQGGKRKAQKAAAAADVGVGVDGEEHPAQEQQMAVPEAEGDVAAGGELVDAALFHAAPGAEAEAEDYDDL